MKEYTIIAIVAVIAALLFDRLLGTRLSSRREFWIFWVVMTLLTTIVNGYLTWRPIVIYGEGHYLGVRVWTIPIEDYLFGFGLITLNLVIWEFWKSRGRRTGQTGESE